jgi:DNA-binding NarL/FixJ family response regulator
MDIRVLVFEDNQSLRNSIYQLVNGTEGFTCVGAHENCSHLLDAVDESRPDIVLMDIQMPGINGIEAVKLIREKYPHLKILMQTIFEDEDKIFNSIYAGASGYILKNTSPARFLEFIKETYEGGAPLSPSVAAKVLKMVAPKNGERVQNFDLSEREKEILSCLVKGMSYKLIANACFISIDTVRGHIRNIYDKLHVHSKSEAVANAIQNKIVKHQVRVKHQLGGMYQAIQILFNPFRVVNLLIFIPRVITRGNQRLTLSGLYHRRGAIHRAPYILNRHYIS